MKVWKIYDKNGTEKCETKKLVYSGEFMGACSVSVSISSPTAIGFELGDWLEYRGERFELNYDPSVVKSASSGMDGEGFVYDDVVFNSLSDELTRCAFLDHVTGDNGLHYYSLPTFSFFADSVKDLAERIQANLDRVYKDEKAWTVEVNEDADKEANINVSIQNNNVWEALGLVNSLFGMNFSIRGRRIIIGASKLVVKDLFSYGKGNGLYKIEKNAESDQQIITRLRAYGSTRNLPDDYYVNLEEGLPNNMAVTNLMLPSFPYETYDPYIDSPNIETLGVREGVVFFDGSSELQEIYPSMEGMTAELLRNAGVYVNATGELDIVLSADVVDDDGKAPAEGEGEPLQATFKVRIKDIGFDINDHLSADNAILAMQDGMCGGREFEIVKCEKTSEGYELTCNRSEDAGLGLFFPYKDYPIRGKDKFVLLNIEMPEVYVKVASQKLLEAAKAYLAKNDSVRYSYSLTVDNLFMARQHDEAASKGEASIHDTIKEGDLMLFDDEDLGINGSVTIASLSIKEDLEGSLIPEYDITLQDKKSVGTIQKIQNQFANLAAHGTGGAVDEEQVKGIIEAVGKRLFLSKVRDDRSRGLIASDKGFEAGRFVTGMIGGSGAKLGLDENKKSVLEVDKVVGREELVVPVITFNTIEVVSGDKANTFAFGVIKEVDTERGIAHLDLLAEEYGTLQAYDILRGVFHNINGGNDTETKEDENGFLQYSGFFTSYFTPNEILTNKAGEMSFRYSLQDGTAKHPCAGMKFFAYGNFVDKDRQSITYENRDYKRRLVKMDSWGINPTRNIAMQDGKLDNLTIGGFKMNGYGTFQTNSYFTGAMIEFTPDQLEDLKGEDAYAVSLSSYEGIVKVDAEGNVTNGLTSELNVTTGGMNVVTDGENVVTTGFNLRTTVQASKGSTPLFYSTEVVKGSFIMSISSVGCVAEIRNGSVVVTEINDLKNCYVDITINCEGKYPVEKRYTITGVYDGQSVEMETIYSKEKEPQAPEEKHPYEDNEVWNHEVSEENVWMAVATKKNEEWTPWQVTRIKGFDAFEYKVLPETTSIGRTMTGSLSPNVLHLSYCRIEQGKKNEVNAIWRVQRWKSEAEGWVNTDYTNEGKSIDFVFPTSDSMDNGWKQYRFIAYLKDADETEAEATEATATATIVEDGKSGQMARYCGVWKSGAKYVWDENYRDIVIYNGNAYQVKAFGAVVSGDSFDPTEWNEASKFDFVAMDTALINGANIAGFTFTVSEYRNGVPYGVLASANNNIVLDAATGKLSCKGASVDGDFNVGSIAFKTKINGGSMKGHSLALGGNSFQLPVLQPGQNMEIKAIFPAEGAAIQDELGFITGQSIESAGILVYNEEEKLSEYRSSISLNSNTLYTIFGYCDEKTGYTTWIVGGSYGGSGNAVMNFVVDKSIVAGSNNPVSGGAVYTALQNKIQEISTDGEATEPNVLYVITNNQG